VTGEEKKIPVSTAELGIVVARLDERVEGMREDVTDIKDMLKNGNDKFGAIEERLVCLETEKKAVGRMAAILSWIAAITAGAITAIQKLHPSP